LCIPAYLYFPSVFLFVLFINGCNPICFSQKKSSDKGIYATRLLWNLFPRFFIFSYLIWCVESGHWRIKLFLYLPRLLRQSRWWQTWEIIDFDICKLFRTITRFIAQFITVPRIIGWSTALNSCQEKSYIVYFNSSNCCKLAVTAYFLLQKLKFVHKTRIEEFWNKGIQNSQLSLSNDYNISWDQARMSMHAATRPWLACSQSTQYSTSISCILLS
jgi:hypothetical protein